MHFTKYQVDGTEQKVEKGIYYYHADHLGSSSSVTNKSGGFHEHNEYFPYGETWVSEKISDDVDGVHYKFTGKEQDPETNLYYFGARYYDPVVSQWLTVDPVMDFKNPTDLNLYSFNHNNPINIIDPDGRTEKNAKHVILWSYSKAETLKYRDKKTRKMNWKKFEKENAFSVAAKTFYDKLLESNVKKENIIFKRIDNKKQLSKTWNNLSKNYKIKSMRFISHGYEEGGAEVAGGSGDFWDNPTKLSYTKNAFVVLHGCNTAPYAKIFANQQKVTTYGQKGFSNFSTNPFIQIPWTTRNTKYPTGPLYLYHFESRLKEGTIHVNSNGMGEEYRPER